MVGGGSTLAGAGGQGEVGSLEGRDWEGRESTERENRGGGRVLALLAAVTRSPQLVHTGAAYLPGCWELRKGRAMPHPQLPVFAPIRGVSWLIDVSPQSRSPCHGEVSLCVQVS